MIFLHFPFYCFAAMEWMMFNFLMIFQRDDDREGYQELYKRKGRSLLMKICLPGDGDEGSGREHAE